MALHELPGTVDFLTDAAHLLLATAPETSTHLMSQRRQLLQQAGIQPSDVQRQHVCNACGYIMVSGKETTLKIEARKAIVKRKKTRTTSRHQKDSPSGVRPPKTKALQCGNCKGTTRIPLPAPSPAIRHNPKVSSIKNKSAPLPAVEASKPTANASSKKRAKNRKAGLQALLSGQKQQTANPLSLASFMRK